MTKEELIDQVIDQMLKDIHGGVFAPIRELLLTVPDNILESFLSEVPNA
jgi:hypothetical protein